MDVDWPEAAVDQLDWLWSYQLRPGETPTSVLLWGSGPWQPSTTSGSPERLTRHSPNSTQPTPPGPMAPARVDLSKSGKYADHHSHHDGFMAEVGVRPAAMTDLPALAAVDETLIEGSERWAELEELLARGGGLLAEDLSGDSPSVVGYVAVAPHHFFGRDFIALLVVAHERRRRGVGAQLLSDATSRASTNTVFTSTNQSNEPMRALLNREHWLVSGILDGLDDGDPEIVFYRRARP